MNPRSCGFVPSGNEENIGMYDTKLLAPNELFAVLKSYFGARICSISLVCSELFLPSPASLSSISFAILQPPSPSWQTSFLALSACHSAILPFCQAGNQSVSPFHPFPSSHSLTRSLPLSVFIRRRRRRRKRQCQKWMVVGGRCRAQGQFFSCRAEHG